MKDKKRTTKRLLSFHLEISTTAWREDLGSDNNFRATSSNSRGEFFLHNRLRSTFCAVITIFSSTLAFLSINFASGITCSCLQFFPTKPSILTILRLSSPNSFSDVKYFSKSFSSEWYCRWRFHRRKFDYYKIYANRTL